MIGKLTGILDTVGVASLIVDVGGVGYEVVCSSRTLAGLPAVGEPVSLSIDTHVREDAIRLYGFRSEHERAWFRALQSVQGVGARLAIAVLGTLSTSDLANAVALQDKSQIARAPGVGPKVAQRIVGELRDKMPSLSPAFTRGGEGKDGEDRIEVPVGFAAQEAVSALTNLGYGKPQAAAAIAAAAVKIEGAPKTEELIRLGLKELAR
jgi:holliday junction DNA helicase RuvA